jgi:hypothetical protein
MAEKLNTYPIGVKLIWVRAGLSPANGGIPANTRDGGRSTSNGSSTHVNTGVLSSIKVNYAGFFVLYNRIII